MINIRAEIPVENISIVGTGFSTRSRTMRSDRQQNRTALDINASRKPRYVLRKSQTTPRQSLIYHRLKHIRNDYVEGSKGPVENRIGRHNNFQWTDNILKLTTIRQRVCSVRRTAPGRFCFTVGAEQNNF